MDMFKVVMLWHSEDEDVTEEEFEYCATYLEEIESSEDVDGKYVTYSTVYKDNNTGKYYRASTVRTNCGYWGDSDKVSERCVEVVPKEITKTIYVAVK